MTRAGAASTPTLVVIGASWGGFTALSAILGDLGRDFALPIAVVQHRTADAGPLSQLLAGHSSLPIYEVDDKSPLDPGRVHIAPADYHLLVEGDTLALSADEKVQYSRPSIDVLFESAADSHGDGTCGVILTGANADGAEGLRAIWAAGGTAIVEDPASALRAEMPRAALQAVPGAKVLPVEEIAPCLTRLAGGGP